MSHDVSKKVEEPWDAAEFAALMRNTSGDTEQRHSEADDLMCEQLRRLGFGDAVDAFEAMEKWYA